MILGVPQDLSWVGLKDVTGVLGMAICHEYFPKCCGGDLHEESQLRFLKASKDRRPNRTSSARSVRLGEFLPSHYLHVTFRFLAV